MSRIIMMRLNVETADLICFRAAENMAISNEIAEKLLFKYNPFSLHHFSIINLKDLWLK